MNKKLTLHWTNIHPRKLEITGHKERTADQTLSNCKHSKEKNR